MVERSKCYTTERRFRASFRAIYDEDKTGHSSSFRGVNEPLYFVSLSFVVVVFDSVFCFLFCIIHHDRTEL